MARFHIKTVLGLVGLNWSANWAYVRDRTRDLLYRDGSQKVFLSDYWDLTFGAYRMVR